MSRPAVGPRSPRRSVAAPTGSALVGADAGMPPGAGEEVPLPGYLASIVALAAHEVRAILRTPADPDATSALLAILVCGLGLAAVVVLCADVLPAMLRAPR